MTHIRVEKLNVSINNRRILNNISFEFDTKERILILGESGCGKSTLLLSLMGLTQRFENAEVTGDILIGETSVRNMKPYEISKVLGLTFQNPESQFCSLYPEDEVAFGLENLCIDPHKMRNIINKSLEAVHFPEEKYKNDINALSGGEQQRLALAAIFAQGAEMFLLDEPTANLDPIGRKQIVKSSKLLSENGKGLLVVEHNLEPWLPFLHRLIVLRKDGTLLCDGTSRDMFLKYGEEFEATGIWRPYSVRIYEELRRGGHKLCKIPLNSEELIEENIPENLMNSVFHALGHDAEKGEEPSKKVMLEVQKLSAGYKKEKTIIRNISLKILEGDFFALAGCNGSGKSTLVKSMIRLIEPSGGNVFFYGQDMSEMKLKDIFNHIGYVFQNPEHQFVEDTVWSEIAYSVDQMDINAEEKRKLTHNLLSEFELEALAKSNPFSLSGGQKRRLSVATMLAGNQKLLILDEPTFGQDEKNAYKLMNKLKELNKRGITIFMITHDVDLIEEYANKTCVMHNGTLVFCGRTCELWKEKSKLKNWGLDMPVKMKVMLRNEDTYD